MGKFGIFVELIPELGHDDPIPGISEHLLIASMHFRIMVNPVFHN